MMTGSRSHNALWLNHRLITSFTKSEGVSLNISVVT